MVPAEPYIVRVTQQTGLDRWLLGRYAVSVDRPGPHPRYVGIRWARSLAGVRTAARSLVLQDLLNQAMPESIPVPTLEGKAR